jgi:tRNA uridine 5-carbamoylmethylation protein Kti12
VLAHRLCDAITKKLDQMEKGMESGELNSSDYERDAKSVAQMISGMEKVAAVGGNGDKQRKPKAAEPTVSDVERLRREIVERFERLQRSRNASPRSG